MNHIFTDSKLLDALDAIQLDCEQLVSSCSQIPDRRDVILLVKALQALMFPCFYRIGDNDPHSPEHNGGRAALVCAREGLEKLISLALPFAKDEAHRSASQLTDAFLCTLPDIKHKLTGDARAIFEGDPAATTCEEVVICYPGFYAISIHRIAHELFRLRIPLLPRIMSEFAHEKTGIDIHPGAQIGERFFIDHGTGIVIGETCRIGRDVKVYQGVTLGAKSFALDENGMPVKGIHRHPQIGDRVVLYANAVILGGDTVIGSDSVIGGNVWLDHSVPEGSVIYYDSKPGIRAKNANARAEGG